MTIDSHVHFWKYDKSSYPWIDNTMKILQKDHLPEDLQLTLKRNNVDGCVAVQASTEEVETRFLAELASTHSYVQGVVGWTDLTAPDVQKKLEEFRQYPVIRGLRHIIQSEPDDYLYRQDFRNGVSLLKEYGFTYDILIYPRQLKAARDFVAEFPDLTFILDHAAKPEIRNRELANWREGLEALAAYPNVFCKLSGLTTEARWKEWSPADFYPYLDVIFKAFGTDRLLYGSDWPVMLLSGIYVQWKSLLEKYMEGFVEEDRQKVFGENAKSVYGL